MQFSIRIGMILLFGFVAQIGIIGQTTFTKDIASIVYNKCTSCHRPGEIGPFSMTNFEEVKGRGATIKYVISNRYMPPWKPNFDYQHYLSENYLTDGEINSIKDWVDSGMPYGNASEEPAKPIFPDGSSLGKPDLVLTFAKSHTHKGNRKDEYRYFVLPTGLTEDKTLKAIELRAGNKKIVHHALFFEDTEGKARLFDAKTPEYGFAGISGFTNDDVILYNQYPGYAPGQKPLFFPDGIGQKLSKGSDLVVQIHYAPISTDQTDSTTVNIFFAKDEEKVERIVDDEIMLPFHLTTGPFSFIIYANTQKSFEGRLTILEDRSLMGIFPHMHMLGKTWEVWLQRPNGTKENLIKIDNWDFNWQSNYYFKKYIIAPKGSVIIAKASYDNTKDNPVNPNNPPKNMSWGENTTDEMFYLPILSVPYKAGDENIVFEDQTTPTISVVKDNPALSLSPNPVSQGNLLEISFALERGQPTNVTVFDQSGKLVRTLRQGTFFARGNHIIHLATSNMISGNYYINVTTAGGQATKSFSVF